MSNNFVAIGEFCEVGDGAHSKVQRVSSGVPYLTSKNIGHGKLKLNDVSYISPNDFNKLFSPLSKAVRRPQAGDLLLGIIGTFGNSYLYKKEDNFGISSSIAIIRPDKSKIAPLYLYYAINSENFRKQHSAHNAGSVQGYTNIPTIKSLKVPLLPLDTQHKIANILSTLDKKVSANENINQTLEEMAQAIFKSWFVDFDPVKAKAQVIAQGGSEQDANLAAMQIISGKTRDQLAALEHTHPEQYTQLHTTASLFPSAFVDSELGEIPEGWEVNSIENIAILTSDRMSSAELNNENYISTENMLENKRGITAATSHPNKGKVPAFLSKDILISNIRPYFKKIWFAAFDGGRSPDVLGFRAKDSELAEFLYNLLYQDCFFDHMMRTSKGVKMPRGDKEAIMQWKFVMPTREISSQYSNLTMNIYTRIYASTKQSESLKNIRNLLLPELLSGSIQL